MQIKLLVEGGAMQPGPALAQKIGPLGLNVGQIIQQVNDATKNFKGLKVPVEIFVEPSTKKIEVRVSSPSVAELLKKGLTETSPEKKKSLDEYFLKVKKQQEELAKQEQVAKEAAEAAALAAKGATTTATTVPAKEGEAAKTPATAVAAPEAAKKEEAKPKKEMKKK